VGDQTPKRRNARGDGLEGGTRGVSGEKAFSRAGAESPRDSAESPTESLKEIQQGGGENQKKEQEPFAIKRRRFSRSRGGRLIEADFPLIAPAS